MKLYREVKASERLPSDITFKVIRDVTTSSKSFIHLVFSEVGGLYTPHVPEYWLEPIQSHHPQPISDERIKELSLKWKKENDYTHGADANAWSFEEGAKAALTELGLNKD